VNNWDYKGHDVEKDLGMEMYHLAEAAVGGHPTARFSLACSEGGIEGMIEQ